MFEYRQFLATLTLSRASIVGLNVAIKGPLLSVEYHVYHTISVRGLASDLDA
jgi:hypothetical protein